ncbi:MAG: BatA domain-containing protein, partial [Pseudomonadota bacterium]|nr:BatA domain-containing protein [Pseudomonadota bacterium]
MMGLLGNIAFLNPWILGGLLLLPALWFLLRITPPSPKLIVFPATRFLEGLTPERVTAAKTPWWILLLRILIIALIVTAL